jgi:prepilin-type N-terminal cleavage/methylation domain-containing protein
MRRDGVKKSRARGFSLIELLVATVILLTVVAVVMGYISGAQRRFDSEQTKIDMVQQSREFMDQMARDLHMVGYPNSRMYRPGFLPAPNWYDSRFVAAGIASLSATQLLMEGDVDSDGTVDAIVYQLVRDFPAGAPVPASCPCRMQRGRSPKIDGVATPVPMNQPLPAFYVEAQGVINSANTIPLGAVGPGGFAGYTAQPIFQAYDVNGVPIALPIDMDTANPANIDPATGKPWVTEIRTIRVTLNVLGVLPDNQTGVRPVTTMSTTARINNY